VLALFVKIVRKINKQLTDIQKEAISAELPAQASLGPTLDRNGAFEPVDSKLTDELEEAGKEVTSALREKQRAMIDSLDLSKSVSAVCPISSGQ
jgi:N-acetyltransferase 10